MKPQRLNITFDIISDKFPVLENNVTEYEKHCVTYLIHNDSQIIIQDDANDSSFNIGLIVGIGVGIAIGIIIFVILRQKPNK